MKKFSSRWALIATTFFALGMASSAHAVWTVTSASTFSSDNAPPVAINSVTGYYVASTLGTTNWTPGTLVSYPGLGMTTGTDNGAPFHALDNNQNTEAVLLGFSGTSIALSGIGLSYTHNGTTQSVSVDASVFRWTGLLNANLAAVAPNATSGGAMSGWELVGNYGNLAETINTGASTNLVNSSAFGSSWWLISAYNSGFSGSGQNVGLLDNGNDYFKLFSVAGNTCTSTAKGVCSGKRVPEPGSLALLAAGLIGVFGVRRHRNLAQKALV